MLNIIINVENSCPAFVEESFFFLEFFDEIKLKLQQLFKTEMFCYIVNAFALLINWMHTCWIKEGWGGNHTDPKLLVTGL